MQRIAMNFDVTAAAGLDEPCTIAATLYLPDEHPAGAPRRAVLLVPGSTHTRRYYDLEVPGEDDYSAAAQLVRRGYVVLALDNLGTGASTTPVDGNRVTLRPMAASIAETARQYRAGLIAGTLHPGIAAVERPFLLGVGHSLGGCLMTLQQAEWSSCDAVAILGWTCQYIQHAVDSAGVPQWTREATGPGYGSSDITARRSFYHHENVAAKVVAADEAQGRTTMPDGMAEVLKPGFSAPYAARIDVPVLLAFGNVDVSPDPFAEPGFYRASHDITLIHLPVTAHCHNMSVHRVALWERIGNWADGFAG